MSIHQEFAEAILNGRKTVEFRKRKLADTVTHVIIYATKPVSAIVGVFQVLNQIQMEPTELWEVFGSLGGIDRERFSAYYEGSSSGVVIEIGDVIPLEIPMELFALGINAPPQSVQYLSIESLEAITVANRSGGF